MRFDFTEDKRLMEVSGQTGGGSPSILSAEEQQMAVDLGKAGGDQTKIRDILLKNRDIMARRAAADKNAGVIGGSEAEAQAGVQKRAGDNSLENSANAARNTQDVVKDAYLKAIALFNQSTQGLMNAEQSIEQMKAGFSGMLETLGIVCKKLGLDDFAQGCLDLAKDLRPQLVKPSPEGLKAAEDYKNGVYIDPTVTQGILTAGRKSAAKEVSEQQDAVVQGGVKGVGDASKVPQPTVVDPKYGTSNRTVSSGISIENLNSAMDKLMKGPSPILLGSEAIELQDKFKKFAKGDNTGNTNLIDNMTERAIMAAAIRSEVKNPQAEQKLLTSLGLSGPASPSKTMGGV